MFTSELLVPTEHIPGLSTLEVEPRSGEAGGFVPNSGADCTGAPRVVEETWNTNFDVWKSILEFVFTKTRNEILR